MERYQLLETVGAILLKGRKDKNLSIKEISDKILIKAEYLEALENNNFSIMPSQVHTNGFLTSYARFLDLNVNEIIVQLNKQRLLEQATPYEAFFIPKKKTSIISSIILDKKNLSFGILAFGIFLSIYFLFFQKSPHKKTSHVNSLNHIQLNQNFPEHTFVVHPKGEFSFWIDDTEIKYQLVNMTKKSIVLKNIKSNKVLILQDREILKHDYNDDLVYDYSISIESLGKDSLTVMVSLNKTIRLEHQQNFATFMNQNQNVDNYKNIIIRNNSQSRSVTIIVVREGKRSEVNIIKSLDSYKTLVVNGRGERLEYIYISNLRDVFLNIQNEIVRKSFPKGSVGVLHFKKENKNRQQYELFY